MAKEKSKKSKVLTSVAAVVLAASMLIGGGTYAYLQGETEDVVNSFNTNEVTVDLTETTGNDYNIIPGTSEDKDPKVTVNNTVDAYVFVEVTDATEGLVDYTIADGWTLLDGYDNVYYREVSKDAAVKEFDVLAGNTVTYDAALTNTDMVDADGNLKDGIDLTFKAYAVQKDPFGNPADAWLGKDAVETKDAESLQAAISEGEKYIIVSDDIETNDSITIPAGADVNLVLSDNTITSTKNHTIVVEDSGTLSITGGTIDALANGKAAIKNNQGGTVTVENVNLTRSKEAGTSSEDSGNNSYYVVDNKGTMTFNEGTNIVAIGAYSSLVENGWYNPNENTTKEPAILTINGGTYISGLNTIKNDDYGTLAINNGYFNNKAQQTVLNWSTATINGGVFVSENGPAIASGTSVIAAKTTITGGTFDYTTNYAIQNDSTSTAAVSGGSYCTNQISKSGNYVVDGYTIQENVVDGQTRYDVIAQ